MWAAPASQAEASVTIDLLAVLIGIVVGWIGGLAMRTNSQLGILLDVLAGVVGALLGPRLFGGGTTFDNVMAAVLLALIFLGLWSIAKRSCEA